MSDDAASQAFERLSEIELSAAEAAGTDQAKTAHLDQAAVYAHLSEKHRPKPDGLATTADIIGLLQTALDAADRLNLHTGAIHINDAIIALGGLGSAPPEPV